LGILAGALITIQSVLNAALGERTGNLGSVLMLTLVSIVVLLFLILLFPGTADFRAAPGLARWYLYLGGVLGIAILAAPIFLIPRIGATSTLTALVLGQLLLALLIDHFGWFAAPRITADGWRIAGMLLVVAGAFLVTR
jgi:transporter family-2 protein